MEFCKKLINEFKSYVFIDDHEEFEMFINEGEYQHIVDWVLKKDNIETGGDLFGLWIEKSKCVIQYVIGPGRQCCRSDVCFYQDTRYLDHCGQYLILNHGLCNIGQWHSHHRLGLTQPSIGDKRTVWEHMPRLNLNTYIVCIATIEDTNQSRSPAKVNLNCFLFEYDHINKKRRVREGRIVKLAGNSPLRLNPSIYREIEKGAESINRLLIDVNELECLKNQNVSIFVEDCENQLGKRHSRKNVPDSDKGMWLELKDMSGNAKMDGEEQMEKQDEISSKSLNTCESEPMEIDFEQGEVPVEQTVITKQPYSNSEVTKNENTSAILL